MCIKPIHSVELSRKACMMLKCYFVQIVSEGITHVKPVFRRMLKIFEHIIFLHSLKICPLLLLIYVSLLTVNTKKNLSQSCVSMNNFPCFKNWYLLFEWNIGTGKKKCSRSDVYLEWTSEKRTYSIYRN